MLLQKLIDRQVDLALTDKEFATCLHIGRSTWTLTKNRGTPIGLRVLIGVVAEFRDLHTDCLNFLRERGHSHTNG